MKKPINGISLQYNPDKKVLKTEPCCISCKKVFEGFEVCRDEVVICYDCNKKTVVKYDDPT